MNEAETKKILKTLNLINSVGEFRGWNGPTAVEFRLKYYPQDVATQFAEEQKTIVSYTDYDNCETWSVEHPKGTFDFEISELGSYFLTWHLP